jgi:ABC-type lipoprotein export system ATPase subunit
MIMKKLCVTCHLQNIVLERDNGFKLEVSGFQIPPQKDSMHNKIPFMGVSGAGKSTLLNIMAAIEWPHRGTVSWQFPDNAYIEWSGTGPSPSEVRKLRREYFGYAFQDSTLMAHLRICENLSYPLEFKGYSSKQAHEIAWETLEKVLLSEEKKQKDELFKRFPSQLSGGQRQRVALVQAMIHDPYVLFADEPTGSLDRETRKQVMEVLYEWVDDWQHTGKRLLLWVTHHENDPRDAGVHHMLYVRSGLHEWCVCGRNERKSDHVKEER